MEIQVCHSEQVLGQTMERCPTHLYTNFIFVMVGKQLTKMCKKCVEESRLEEDDGI